jgi:hypothetical protein
MIACCGCWLVGCCTLLGVTLCCPLAKATKRPTAGVQVGWYGCICDFIPVGSDVKGSEEMHLEGLKFRAHPAENLRRPCF